MAHGTNTNFELIAPRSRLYQGPYGRICPDLPAWSPDGVCAADIDSYFIDIANGRMIEEADASRDADRGGSKIPAGYTYFGQFVDHDITFDPTSSLMRQNDPNGILNFRTPRLDLDCVYGRGPDEQPYLYDQDDVNPSSKQVEKLLIGRLRDCPLRDLPRNSQGRALLGDKRNDEHAIISQLHLAFLLAHNALVQRARDLEMTEPFEAARQSLRWLYQYVVWNDFIKRVTSENVHKNALTLVDKAGSNVWELGFKHVYNWKSHPFMPIEFSVAAYRFGHSMVRDSYRTNEPHRGLALDRAAPIFGSGNTGYADDLRGRRPMTELNVIQWNWFLQMSSPEGFPQMARKIDTKLSKSLALLPGETVPRNLLAYRNLKRGWTFGLPAGTAVAGHFGISAVPAVDEFEPHADPDALWFYILREANSTLSESRGSKLGPLGSLIVCATFAGLLKGDPLSYINVAPHWTPERDHLLKEIPLSNEEQRGGPWTLASIIRIAGLPVTKEDVCQQTHGVFRMNS
jgi:hypothetical protein